MSEVDGNFLNLIKIIQLKKKKKKKANILKGEKQKVSFP